MESEDALKTYAAHDVHEQFKALFKPYVAGPSALGPPLTLSSVSSSLPRGWGAQRTMLTLFSPCRYPGVRHGNLKGREGALDAATQRETPHLTWPTARPTHEWLCSGESSFTSLSLRPWGRAESRAS